MKLFALVFAFVALSAHATKVEPYHEVGRFKLGGDGGWDLMSVDEAGERLYVARADRIMVIDVKTGKLLGEVPGVDGAHGAATVPALNLGFATAGKLGTVVVFDLKTLKATGQIKVGEKPDVIMYEPVSGKVWAFNGKSKDISVIDPKAQKVVATLALDGKPELAVSDGEGKIFLNLEDKNSVVAIDSKKMTILKTYALKPCEDPSGISMNKTTHHLFVGCGNNLAAMLDSRTGKVLKTLPVGEGVDGAEFDANRHLAFIPSGGEGKLSIFQESGASFELVQDVATQKGARTLAFDKKSGKVFLATAEFGPAPAATAENQHPRPSIMPGTFAILVLGQ